MAKHNKYEIVYSIGDHVVITKGPWVGRRGEVVQRRGFFTKKYVVRYSNGGESPLLPSSFLDFYN